MSETIELAAEAFRGATKTGRLLDLGVGARQMRRSGLWVRYEHGLWTPAWHDATDPDVRIERAKELLRGGGAIGGWAAARMHGVPWATGLDSADAPAPILVCLNRRDRCRRTSDVRVFRSNLDPDEVVVINGIPVTSAVRTFVDLARLTPDRDDAVAAVDALRAATQIDLDQVQEWYRSRSRWLGVEAARRVTALSRHGVKSPQETHLRLVWMLDAGLPEPLVNVEVLTEDGQVLCEADLFDPSVGLAAEYDGADHAGAARRSIDARRRDEMRRAGVTPFIATGGDLSGYRRRTARLLQRAWSEAAARDSSGDRWYLRQPA